MPPDVLKRLAFICHVLFQCWTVRNWRKAIRQSAISPCSMQCIWAEKCNPQLSLHSRHALAQGRLQLRLRSGFGLGCPANIMHVFGRVAVFQPQGHLQNFIWLCWEKNEIGPIYKKRTIRRIFGRDTMNSYSPTDGNEHHTCILSSWSRLKLKTLREIT